VHPSSCSKKLALSHFIINIFKGFRSTGGGNNRFPIDFAGHRYNSADATAQPVIEQPANSGSPGARFTKYLKICPKIDRKFAVSFPAMILYDSSYNYRNYVLHCLVIILR